MKTLNTDNWIEDTMLRGFIESLTDTPLSVGLLVSYKDSSVKGVNNKVETIKIVGFRRPRENGKPYQSVDILRKC